MDTKLSCSSMTTCFSETPSVGGSNTDVQALCLNQVPERQTDKHKHACEIAVLMSAAMKTLPSEMLHQVVS
jgi:hypothetical protein